MGNQLSKYYMIISSETKFYMHQFEFPGFNGSN